MFVISDNVFVAAGVEYRQLCDTLADGAKFVKQMWGRFRAVTLATQPLNERVMDRRRLADALKAGKFVGERDGGGTLDVEARWRSLSTFTANSTH